MKEKKTDETETIMQQLEKVAAEICDNYCKFMAEMGNDESRWDELTEKHCDKCPLEKLF